MRVASPSRACLYVVGATMTLGSHYELSNGKCISQTDNPGIAFQALGAKLDPATLPAITETVE